MRRALLISLLALVLLAVVRERLGSPGAGPDLPSGTERADGGATGARTPALEALETREARQEVRAPASTSPDAVESPLAPDAPEEWPPEEEILSDGELLERAGLPADTPLALRIGRFGPPDPLEVGRAALLLTLRDQATGEAVGGEVVLWRLNAPANVYWTAGDQDVARARVPPEGHVFEGLPSGEYRPVVLDERAAAPYHAPLHVSGRTVHEIFVARPRARPVRIQLDDSVTRVEAYFQGEQNHPRVHVPPWVALRAIQPDFDGVLEFEMTEGDPWFTQATWVPLTRTALGYDAGTLREDTRHATVTHTVSVRVDGVSRGDLVLRNPPSGDDAILVFRLP